MSSGNTHQEVRIEVKGKLDDPLQKIKSESLPLLPDTLLSAILPITLKGITKIPLYKCFSYYSMKMLSTVCDCLNNPIDGTNNTPFFIILTCPLYNKWCKMPFFFFIIFIYHIWLNFNIRCHSIMIVFIIKLRDINQF